MKGNEMRMSRLNMRIIRPTVEVQRDLPGIPPHLGEEVENLLSNREFLKKATF